MSLKRQFWCCAVLLAGMASTLSANEPEAKIVEIKKIWDSAPHNAFTDLAFHNGHWYCVFREGKGHVSPDGALRILTSTDGKEWTSAALVTAPDADLRDAKIFVTEDGRLQLSGAGAWHKPKEATHQSFVWYSNDGKEWGEAISIADPGYWVWRIVDRDGAQYGLGYETKKKTFGTRLYKSEDGRKFKAIVPTLTGPDMGYANEAALLFLADGTLLSVLRRDTPGKLEGLLGTAKAPYTEWSWKPLNLRIGGPDMLQLPDGRIVVAGRDYVGGATTRLWWLDTENQKLNEIVKLPSGGDTSYPGLVYKDGFLWVSYYSSHEGKTSIYLAKVQLPPASP